MGEGLQKRLCYPQEVSEHLDESPSSEASQQRMIFVFPSLRITQESRATHGLKRSTISLETCEY